MDSDRQVVNEGLSLYFLVAGFQCRVQMSGRPVSWKPSISGPCVRIPVSGTHSHTLKHSHSHTLTLTHSRLLSDSRFSVSGTECRAASCAENRPVRVPAFGYRFRVHTHTLTHSRILILSHSQTFTLTHSLLLSGNRFPGSGTDIGPLRAL